MFWEDIPSPIIALAPMAGITDAAFRLLCSELGADVVYSEMVHVTALHYNSKKTEELLVSAKGEAPYVVQLFGKEPTHFGEAAQRLTKKGVPLLNFKTGKPGKMVRPAGIDINLGCPAKKVFGHGSGAALMQDAKLTRSIIEAVTTNTTLPVSIKVRTEVRGVKLLDFLRSIKINKLGVAAIMVHGRTYSQGFSGPIDLTVIRAVKKYFKGQVLANGGITEIKRAREVLKKTGADGVGIATGAWGRPEIFRELKQLKEGFGQPEVLTWKEKKKLILKHAKYNVLLKGEKGMREIRKHLLWYTKGRPGVKAWYKEMVKVEGVKDVERLLKKI